MRTLLLSFSTEAINIVAHCITWYMVQLCRFRFIYSIVLGSTAIAVCLAASNMLEQATTRFGATLRLVLYDGVNLAVLTYPASIPKHLQGKPPLAIIVQTDVRPWKGFFDLCLIGPYIIWFMPYLPKYNLIYALLEMTFLIYDVQ